MHGRDEERGAKNPDRRVDARRGSERRRGTPPARPRPASSRTPRAVFDPNSAMASVSVPAKTPVSVPDVASP